MPAHPQFPSSTSRPLIPTFTASVHSVNPFATIVPTPIPNNGSNSTKSSSTQTNVTVVIMSQSIFIPRRVSTNSYTLCCIAILFGLGSLYLIYRAFRPGKCDENPPSSPTPSEIQLEEQHLQRLRANRAPPGFPFRLSNPFRPSRSATRESRRATVEDQGDLPRYDADHLPDYDLERERTGSPVEMSELDLGTHRDGDGEDGEAEVPLLRATGGNGRHGDEHADDHEVGDLTTDVHRTYSGPAPEYEDIAHSPDPLLEGPHNALRLNSSVTA